MGTFFPDINTEDKFFLEPVYDEEGNLVLSKECVDHLLNHVLSVETGRRGIDSSIKDYESFVLTSENIEIGLKNFDRNYGEFSDGVYRRLEANELYYKITSNISISIDDGIKQTSDSQYFYKILKLKDRSELNLPSLTLYINRKKVPDEEIFVLMTSMKTDILFPVRFLSTSLNEGEVVYNDTEICVEKRVYPKYRYLNRFFKSIKETTISFELKPVETVNTKIDSTTLMLFVNGNLSLAEKTVRKEGNTVNIYSTDIREGTDIEVVVDSNIKIINNVVVENTKRCYFNISESDLDPKINYLYGAIPKKNCYFFINGLRYFNNDIKQVGRMNFVYDAKNEYTYTCTLIYTDKDYIDESNRYIYGDDYYLSNFIGVENVSKLLNGEVVNEYINDPNLNLDFHKIMNLNGERYKREYAEKINDIVNTVSSYEAKTKEILKLSNHLVRDFLNLYGRKEIYKTIVISEEDEIDEFYRFCFHTRKDIASLSKVSYYYIIDINGEHIVDTDIEVEDNYIYDNIKIKGKCFKKGINRVHIKEFKYNISGENSIDYKIINKDSIIDQNGVYLTVIQPMDSVMSTDDLICLQYSRKEESVYYDPESDDNGWKVKKDVSFQLNDDRTISVIFETLPEEDLNLCIYSKRFNLKFNKMVMNDMVGLEDITIPIRSSSGDFMPIIPIGGYMVYLNDKLLFNGIDYVFRHPGNYDNIAYSSLGLKRRVKTGDVITIYFNDVKNEVIGRSNDVLSKEGVIQNKYGLIYFGKLKYPYSPRYINLYINGKFIHPSEIDILSDKLIRVPGVHNPMFDIYAESSFSTDPDRLKSFFNYENTELEKAIAGWFVDFDFSALVDPTDDSLGNKVYESFDDNVDSVGKVPNPIFEGDINEEVPTRYNLLENAYLLWLKSNNVKTIIDCKQNILQHIVNYFKFYTEESSLYERQDIVVSKNTKLFNSIILDRSKYPTGKETRKRLILEHMKENDMTTKDIFGSLRDDLTISNVLYPRDFPKTVKSKDKIDLKGMDILIGGTRGTIFTKHSKNEQEGN